MAGQYIDIHKAIVDRCRAGDSKAQYELYHLYAKAMFNIAMRIVDHAGDAEDILQESFLEAFGKIGDFRADGTFGGWLKRIVINRSVNSIRRRRLQLFDTIPGADQLVADVYEYEEQQWEVQQVHRAIMNLPDGYRVVLSLYLLEGYDHSEIAEILNITESTSRSQYNRAKAKVREQLTNKNYAG